MRSKKGAIELSIGTIIIVVLGMTMLIFGLILIKNIFTGSTEAVKSINREVIKNINNIFTDPDKKLAIYPSSGAIELKQKDRGKGFAFSVKNTGINTATYSYEIVVDPNFNIQKKCGIPTREAQDWISVSEGSFDLGPGQTLEEPEFVSFEIPEDAPPCTIPYKILIKKAGQLYVYGKVRLIIK